MLYGLPSPTHKETPKVFKEVFYDKEKIIEKRYVDILEKGVRLFKEYEHGKLKEISGKEIDVLMKDTDDYIKRMKKLRGQIEKVSNKNIIGQIEKDVFELLENLYGKKSKAELIKTFDKELVKKGKFDKKDVNNARKDSTILINDLIDYGQRCDLVALEKTRMQLTNKKGDRVELILTDSGAFIIEGSTVKKVTDKKIVDSSIDEFNKAVKAQKGDLQVKADPDIFNVIKKEFGDFEILL
jgi:hypothetical protein